MPDLVKLGLLRFLGKNSRKPQRLIQPLNQMMVGSGFKSPKYKARGVVRTSGGEHMDHFGADYWQAAGTTKVLYGMGVGVVLRAGWDTTFGGIVVVRYNNCVNSRRTGCVSDVIVRCYHLATVNIKSGKYITKDTQLGIIGDTGRYCSGVHTHLEVDLDVEHPFSVPGISPTNLLGWKTVKSMTIQDPSEWIHTKVSRPDRQTAFSAGPWYRDAEHPLDCDFQKIT